MFGTDLESAYFDNTHVQPTYTSSHSDLPPASDSVALATNSSRQPTALHVMQQQQNPASSVQSSQPDHSTPTYDAHDLPNPRMIPLYEQQVRNSNKIKELQLELLKQKQQDVFVPVTTEPLYDRYLSKKKDVFKLMGIALTVLFAISLHFVMGDLIKSYLRNNDFSYNKEMLLKFSYPMTVLLMLWSLKVFNK